MKPIQELSEYDCEQRGDAFIYPDIPNELYHSEVGISSSTLRKFGHSQLHAINEEQKTTDAMNFGTAAHYMLVEGEVVFNQEVAVLMGSPYTKAYKENKADMLERYSCVIKETELNHIKGMKENIIDEANMYLQADDKLPEASFFWYEDKVLCKCRPDLICPPFKGLHKPGEIYVVDYKTTKSCDPKQFADSVKYWGYDMQAAWYRRGMEKAGYNVKEFAFVAQEKFPPYASKIFIITDEQMDSAWKNMQIFLDDYNKYLHTGKVSIYNSDSIVTLDLDE
jgi:exodeoxyribonuclease VIII